MNSTQPISPSGFALKMDKPELKSLSTDQETKLNDFELETMRTSEKDSPQLETFGSTAQTENVVEYGANNDPSVQNNTQVSPVNLYFSDQITAQPQQKEDSKQRQKKKQNKEETKSPQLLNNLSIDPKLKVVDANERKAVLVDPLDSDAKHWWPAMIVPRNEAVPEMNYENLNENECIVRYFEDNKYSVVPFTDLALLDQNSSFFLKFKSQLGDEFTSDKGIKAALEYLDNNITPAGFMWPKWEQEVYGHSSINGKDIPYSETRTNGTKRTKMRSASQKSKNHSTKNTRNTNNSSTSISSPSSTTSSQIDCTRVISEIEQEMAELHHDYKKVLVITSQLAKEMWLLERKSLPSGLTLTRQGKKRKYL